MKYLEVKYLLLKELRFELRNRHAFSSILLYLVSSFFLIYLIFQSNTAALKKDVLFSLYWLIVLFTAINAISKSFVQENRGRYFLYYTLVNPRSMVVSKILYNSLMLVVLSLLSFLFFVTFFNQFAENYLLMMLIIATGSLGFGAVLSLVSAIASKTNNNFSLMAVLAFPLLLPLLLTLIKVSGNESAGFVFQNIAYLFVLCSIFVLVFVLAYILFPYLWKE